MRTIPMLTLSIVLLSLGCDLEDDLSDRAADSRLDAAEAPAPRGPTRPPAVLLVEHAVEQGALADDPAMAEALAAMDTAHQGLRTADEALRLALADAVVDAAGSTEVVATELAAIEAAARDEAEALEVALDTAHALLDDDQRAAAVDTLLEAPPPGDRPPPPPGADQGPPPAEADQGPPPAGSDQGPPPPLGHLLGALELDDDQQQALREALPEPIHPEPPDLSALEGFAEDDFEAATLGLAERHAERAMAHATERVELLGILVPLLDDDQLATLVELLREGPTEPEHPERA